MTINLEYLSDDALMDLILMTDKHVEENRRAYIRNQGGSLHALNASEDAIARYRAERDRRGL